MKNYIEVNKEHEKAIQESLFESQGYGQYECGAIENLDEALITFGKSAYPRGGHVVILAGGASSGKGFITDKLLGIEGKTFDVDILKQLAAGHSKFRGVLEDSFKDLINAGEIDKMPDINKILTDPNALRDPDNVHAFHLALEKTQWSDKIQKNVFKNIAGKKVEDKINLIFDVTLANISKLKSITYDINLLGYPKENIHIVWIVNDVEIAKVQNSKRDRVVPEDILVDTHKGASRTMSDIIGMGTKLRKYMDGAIYIAFNKIGVDADVEFGDRTKWTKETLVVVNKSNYVRIKDQGKPIKADQIGRSIISKVKRYVPRDTFFVPKQKGKGSKKMKDFSKKKKVNKGDCMEILLKFNTKDKEIILTKEEAKTLYNELKEIFEAKITAPSFPYTGIRKISEPLETNPYSFPYLDDVPPRIIY